MNTTQHILAATAVALTAACGGPSPEVGPDGGDADAATAVGELRLGGAAADGLGFVELTDGEDVELIGGAQGGFHFWTGYRLRGFMGEVRVERSARRVRDGALVLRAPTQVFEVPEDAMEGWWERPEAVASFMCPAPVGIRVYDEELVLHTVIRNRDQDLLAEDELGVIPRCPTGDLEAFCLDICDG